jgi:histidine triad (HIT) family protein
MDCLFCKIAKGEIPSQKIYEDDFTFAFLDIQPRSPGHAVVIPKVHAENIIDLKSESVAPLFSAVKKVTTLLRDNWGGGGFTPLEAARARSEPLLLTGFTIGINHGKLAGQAIDHLHVHVIPRYEGDQGGSIHSVVHFEDGSTVAEVAKKILAN